MSDPNSTTTPDWHALDIAFVFEKTESTEDGLSQHTVDARLDCYGINRIQPPKRESALVRFLKQFHNVLIYVLLASGVITALLGHWIDSSVIFGVVIINAIIGFIQEGKAERALDAIRNMLSHNAFVKRDGHYIKLPAEQLVPGDIVQIQSGDKVPADLRLFHTRELRIDEAILTGESVPAEKSTQAVEADAGMGDRSCIAYSGTYVSYGRGYGIVIATGDATEIGRISDMLRQVQILTTPLLRQMAVFAKWLTLAIGVVAALTFIYGSFIHNYPLDDMFLAAVGLAVAGIPEGLPAIMTITLAIGVQRMAKNNAIIRRLPAVETLGSVTVICSDKTGTLTRNEMMVQSIATTEGIYEVSGEGYDPHGDFSLNQQAITAEDHSILNTIGRAAVLCNDASIRKHEQHWQVHGDPTEGALISFAHKAGAEQAFTQESFPRLDAIPFESQHRFMATLHHDHADHHFIYVKGAPERVLDMCSMQRCEGDDIPLDRQLWEQHMNSLAKRGQRLLAIAFRATSPEQHALEFHDVDTGLTLLGITGIIDPPRDEAIRAVRLCQNAGIKIKMITGDHAVTASAIGAQMGIGDGKTFMTGQELANQDASALSAVVDRCDIFARTSPEQKLQLVTALQARGHIVAMTGDGVNDAPALKRADIGIAMGHKGTEVAKEASEMVLADDNFASISKAVEEGRTVYDNLKKSILFILPTNGGEALTIIAAIVLGRTLPITAAQILWINMITAVTLALTLAFEPPEKNVMQRLPRDPGEPLLSGFLVWRIIFVSLILVTGTFGLFIWARDNGASIEYARTLAVNTLVMFEIFYLFNSRYLLNSSLNKEGIIGNPYALMAIGLLIIFQLAFTYAPPMQLLFATTAIGLYDWLRIIVIGSSVLFLVELEKAVFRNIFGKGVGA